MFDKLLDRLFGPNPCERCGSRRRGKHKDTGWCWRCAWRLEREILYWMGGIMMARLDALELHGDESAEELEKSIEEVAGFVRGLIAQHPTSEQQREYLCGLWAVLRLPKYKDLGDFLAAQNAEWTRAWPSEAGWYWFYGQRNVETQPSAEPRLVALRLGTLHKGKELFVRSMAPPYFRDTMRGQWSKIVPPMPPELERGDG